VGHAPDVGEKLSLGLKIAFLLGFVEPPDRKLRLINQRHLLKQNPSVFLRSSAVQSFCSNDRGVSRIR